MTGKYLISTDNWFLAPDGRQYKAVWGDVTLLGDDFLGIKTNRNASNWYAKVGSNDNHVIVAGCQIHYAVRSEQPPNINDVPDYQVHEGKIMNVFRPTHIYLAQAPELDNDYPF